MSGHVRLAMKLPAKGPRRDRHHLIPRSRGGTDTLDNLLMINQERHAIWHKMFGNLTLDEVIDLLIRVRRIKRRKAA